MSNVAKRTGLLLGLVLGIVSAFATAGLAFIPNTATIILLLFPGLFLSDFMRVPNSLWLWMAMAVNFCFWFLLSWTLGILIGRIASPRNTSEVP